MANSVNSLLAVCAVVCLASYVTASDIVFTSTPSTIRQLVTDDLTMRCSLTDSAASVVIGKRHIRSDVTSDTAPSDVSFLQTIMISKSGVDLATISEHLAARVFGNSTGVQVTGQVPGSGAEKGYLQVSWKYPVSDQTGSYQCVISGVDQSGHVLTFIQTLVVVESQASLSEVVTYVQQLKLTNDQQAATIAALNLTNNDLAREINGLKTSDADQKLTIAGLNAADTDLKVQLNDLKTTVAEVKTKQSTQVMFTATLGADVNVSNGDVLVFDNVKTNIGDGYDPQSGAFTCPVAGAYMFHLHVEGQKDAHAAVCFRHNNNKNCVTASWVSAGFGFNSASNSAGLSLQQGDTIKVVRSYSSTMYVDGDVYGDTSFSGHLVAAA